MQRFFKEKRLLLRAGAFLLTLGLLAAAFPPLESRGAFDTYKNHIIRVGLNSDDGYTPASTARGVARFQIDGSTGTGFRAGYYNSSRAFVQMYQMAGRKSVSVIRNKNFDVDSQTYVGDGASGNVLGAYHLELEKNYSNQSAVDAAVAAVLSATNYISFPAYTPSGYRVRIGRFKSAAEAQAALATVQERLPAAHSGTLKLTSGGANAYTVFTTDSAGRPTVLFQWDGASSQIALLPYGGTASEAFGPEGITWHNSRKFYGGFDMVKNSDTGFTVVNVVNLAQYVVGVVPYEVSPSWHVESLKVQAVCAATYGYSTKRYTSHGFDVCTTTRTQVYRGVSTTDSDAKKVRDAVESVAGMIITYNGTPITAYYHASNGGYTENSENVWKAVVPYCRAVPDTYEELTVANKGLWTVEFTAEQIRTMFNAQGHGLGAITNVYVSKRTAAGNVYSVAVTDGSKTVTVEKDMLRNYRYFALNSQRFNIYPPGASIYLNDGELLASTLDNAYAIVAGDIVDKVVSGTKKALTADGLRDIVTAGGKDAYVFDGRGWGHSVGMSQRGSLGRANAGHTFAQIIKHYYTGVKIKGLDY